MTTTPTFDLTPFPGRDKGELFDRKSTFEGKKRPRHSAESFFAQHGTCAPIAAFQGHWGAS